MNKKIRKLVRKACDAVGGQSELARKLDIEPQAITPWLKTGHVPTKRVLAIERHTGISRHDLRPDVYPREVTA